MDMEEEKRTYAVPEITVQLEPDGKTLAIKRPKTALQLLKKLELGTTDALIIRRGELLTPDREILPNDEITIRTVTSRG